MLQYNYLFVLWRPTILFFPRNCSGFTFPQFKRTVILVTFCLKSSVDVRSCFIVVLICIPSWLVKSSIFSSAQWPFARSLLRNYFSLSSPIFKSSCCWIEECFVFWIVTPERMYTFHFFLWFHKLPFHSVGYALLCTVFNSDVIDLFFPPIFVVFDVRHVAVFEKFNVMMSPPLFLFRVLHFCVLCSHILSILNGSLSFLLSLIFSMITRDWVPHISLWPYPPPGMLSSANFCTWSTSWSIHPEPPKDPTPLLNILISSIRNLFTVNKSKKLKKTKNFSLLFLSIENMFALCVVSEIHI